MVESWEGVFFPMNSPPDRAALEARLGNVVGAMKTEHLPALVAIAEAMVGIQAGSKVTMTLIVDSTQEAADLARLQLRLQRVRHLGYGDVVAKIHDHRVIEISSREAERLEHEKGPKQGE